MQILRIKVKNYRCIQDLSFIPSKHNILIGGVNSGKSTLLTALSLVLDPDVARRYRPVEELDFFEGQTLDKNENPIPINIEVVLSDCTDDERNHFLEFWEPWDTEKKVLIEDADDISILDKPQKQFAFRIAFQAKYDINEKEIVHDWYYPKFSFMDDSDTYRKCYRPEREIIGFFMIPAERNITKALSFTRYSALDKALRADKISLDKEIGRIGDKVRGVGGILFDNKDFENLIKEIEFRTENILELSPEIERKLTFELSGLGHYDIMNVLKAFMSPEGAPRPYPITNQGMGAKQIITMATLRMLAARKRSSIIAIEEPENSLHPHMQRTLVNDLLNTNCQIFISTHSVHVSQVINPDYLYSILDHGKGNKNILNLKPSKTIGCGGDTIKAMENIQSHYPNSVMDSFFSPRVLLVEGPGDRGAIPVVIRRLSKGDKKNQDLDGLGIAIVPCIGKQRFAKAALYFKIIGKKTYALADSEKGSASEDNSIVDACDCSFFWPENTAIEAVLLEKVTEKTLDDFILAVTELGDDFYKSSGTHTGDFIKKKKDTQRYLKNRLTHRQFAEFLPDDQIPDLMKMLHRTLNRVVSGDEQSKKVIINVAKDSRT